jgi:hypothetical protein
MELVGESTSNYRLLILDLLRATTKRPKILPFRLHKRENYENTHTLIDRHALSHVHVLRLKSTQLEFLDMY